MDRKITITIDTEGKTQVEAHGYKGGTCTKATEPLTKALIGAKPDSDEKKPEFYQADVQVRVAEHE